MKQELRARPVYLSRSDRIQAHFTICFLALMIYRLLEKKLEQSPVQNSSKPYAITSSNIFMEQDIFQLTPEQLSRINSTKHLVSKLILRL
ncbi:Mobile element protein [Streptococcus pneumoniae]|nr:Mobile element protein [Streptococcus pneumoniae]VSF62879.1 Mobile element protein [Streptococcus pneumoniae]